MKRKPNLTELRFDKLAEELKQSVTQQVASSGLTASTVRRLRAEVLQPALLLFQLNWIDDTSPVKVCEKSRRIGLSWSEAADDVLYAASKAGSDVWYLGHYKEMAEGFIQDCTYWAEQFTGAATEAQEIIIKDEDKDILSYRIRFASGYRITALSSRPSNLRSRKGRVIADEVAFNEDFAGLLKAALALTIWGGSVRIISTHNGDSNSFSTLIKDIRAGRKNYGLHRITFNEAVDQGLCKRIFEVTGREWSPEAEIEWVAQVRADYGDDAEEELDVVAAEGNGVPFPRALIERCMSRDLPVIRYEQDDKFLFKDEGLKTSEVESWLQETVKPLLDKLDSKRRCYLGEDFARSGHLTVFTPLQEQQDATFNAPFILEIRNIPFEEQGQIAIYIIDNLPNFSHATFDARGNGQWLAEKCFVKYGEKRITMSMPSEKWYRENMPAYQAAFEDKSLLIPHDADVIEDHRDFRKINGVTCLPKTNDKKKESKSKKGRHGDTGIAGCNAWHATRQDGGPMKYKTLGKRRFGKARGAL